MSLFKGRQDVDFIAADFDENESEKISWQDEMKIFVDACEEFKLPVYLENSIMDACEPG